LPSCGARQSVASRSGPSTSPCTSPSDASTATAPCSKAPSSISPARANAASAPAPKPFRQAKLGEDDSHNPPFYLLTTRLELPGDVEKLIVDLKAAGIEKTALITIDTLNRSIHGSESKDEDMGAYVQAADRLREVFGGLVLVIHHCGINGERPRGHSSLTGAVDAQLKAERSPAGKVMVDVEFLKDGGSEGDRIVLTPITVGEASDGSDITSCIIEASDGDAAPKQKRPHLPPLAKIALKALNKAIGEAGSQAPASNHIPASRRVADLDLWRRYYYQAVPKDDTPEARKKSFQRAREILQGAEVIGLHATTSAGSSDDRASLSSFTAVVAGTRAGVGPLSPFLERGGEMSRQRIHLTPRQRDIEK
jgi:hypothetical protein